MSIIRFDIFLLYRMFINGCKKEALSAAFVAVDTLTVYIKLVCFFIPSIYCYLGMSQFSHKIQ